MSRIRRRPAVAALAALTLVAAACGSDDASSDGASGADQAEGADDAEQPTIVVTTSILGDVVAEVVGDQADVVTIMPVGADPHDFQASAREVDRMVSADALVVNGGAFEEGLVDVIENARDEGVPTFEALSVVETIEFGEGGHDHGDEDHGDEDHEDHGDEGHEDHGDEGHGDEDHEDHGDEDHGDEDHEDHGDEDGHDGHDHDGADPHFFTDPMRMAAAVDGIADFLAAEVAGLDTAALEASAAAYVTELEALDAEVVSLVGAIPDEGRVLVTNHDAFGYFADRFGFEVVGVVIPGGGTTDSVSAGELAELAEVVEAEGVPAIFSETTASDELINVLAGEVGDIEVVELFSGSLGEADSDGATYLDMVRANAQRISAALG